MKIKKNKNLGIELLRMILAFWVLIYHCYKKSKSIQNIICSRLFHVPTFMLLSFYYFYPCLSSRNIEKTIQRFERLFIPYIIWPFIIYIFNNLFLSIFKFSVFNKKLLLKDFYIQILIGTKYYSIFWYHFDLIYITFLFTIIFFIFKNNCLLILQIIVITIIYLRYSGIYLLNPKSNSFININSGTIQEMLPISVTGITFSSLNLIKKIQKCHIKKRIIFFSLTIIYFLFKYNVFIKYRGFRYPDILLNSFSAIFIFIFFSAISLEKIKSKKIYSLIITITQFTGGIYYLHLIIFEFLIKSKLIKTSSFFECIIIYYICYFICLFGNLLFKKTKFKFLFY